MAVPPPAAPLRRRKLLALGAMAAASAMLAPRVLRARPSTSVPSTTPRPPSPLPSTTPPPPSPLPRMPRAERREWEAFKRRFITADGRVVDTGNNNESHSEGQGWGLLFAASFDDVECFDRILDWTGRNLCVRGDALHAWRYQPGAANPVSDLNNATDGDLFIAGALAQAARRWGRPDHAATARAIGVDLLRLTVRQVAGRTLLLPGAEGFEHPDRVVINPSYYAFVMLDEVARLVPSPLWEAVRADGLALIQEGRFGPWMLPPDWLSVSRADGSLAPAASWPARFSYDAIRVPLHLAWAQVTPPLVHHAFVRYWQCHGMSCPAWIDLYSSETAPYPASAGMDAIRSLAGWTRQAVSAARFPSVNTASDYYSASLVMLSRIAWYEIRADGDTIYS